MSTRELLADLSPEEDEFVELAWRAQLDTFEYGLKVALGLEPGIKRFTTNGKVDWRPLAAAYPCTFRKVAELIVKRRERLGRGPTLSL